MSGLARDGERLPGTHPESFATTAAWHRMLMVWHRYWGELRRPHSPDFAPIVQLDKSGVPLFWSHLSPLLCNGKAGGALPDFKSGLSDVNIDDTTNDITDGLLQGAGRPRARPNGNHDDSLEEPAVSSSTTPVALPELENGTVFVPSQALSIRRLAQHGSVDDQSIPDVVSEADETDSEPECGL